MDLVHMATCSIRWAILWNTESIKIRQNQEKVVGGFWVVRIKTDCTPLEKNVCKCIHGVRIQRDVHKNQYVKVSANFFFFAFRLFCVHFNVENGSRS